MTLERTLEYLHSLLKELLSLPQETEWVEFKPNNDDPVMIGEYISALANSAARYGKKTAYVVWGVNDRLPFEQQAAAENVSPEEVLELFKAMRYVPIWA